MVIVHDDESNKHQYKYCKEVGAYILRHTLIKFKMIVINIWSLET